jgi:hypothetical protein
MGKTPSVMLCMTPPPEARGRREETGWKPVLPKSVKDSIVGFDEVELAVFFLVLVAEFGLFVGEVD